MADKRGTWTKSDLKIIWKSYINDKMWNNFTNLKEQDWDWTQAAPCPKCGEKMLKAQYEGAQPEQKFTWNVDHKNGNPHDNYLDNLQPMHPWCNKTKG